MKKIIVIGISGAGKSTFATKLSELLDVPLIHLDQLFWQPGWVAVDKAIFLNKVADVMKTEQWIIDGNFTNSLEMRLEKADTVFYFDFPAAICLWNTFKRIIRYRKQSRKDMTEGCAERLNLEFIRHILTFRRDKAPSIEKLLTETSGKQIFRFKNYNEVDDYLKTLL